MIQRVLPHYRRPVFRRSYQELGWIVAAGEERQAFGLNLAGGEEEWLHRFAIRRSSRFQYLAMVDLAAILRTLRPDAVVAEFSLQMLSTYQLAFRRARGRLPRLAFWSQGANVERGFRHPVDVASQSLRLALMRAADAQLCYSSAGVDYLRARMPARQGIFVAPNTLDVAELRARAVDRSPADGQDAHLLMIGRMMPDKRMEVGMRAVALLRRVMPGVRLTVVGDGPAMSAVRAAALKLGDGVRLLGEVYDEAILNDIFAEASLTLIPGSAGLNVNQSLGFGVPVLLCENGGAVHHHPEHANVRDGVNGFRVALDSAEAIADRLLALLALGSPRRRLAEGIAATVREDLSLDRMIEGMRALHGFLRSVPPRRD